MRRNRRIVVPGSSWQRALVALARFELRAVVVTILASTIVLVGFPIATPTVSAAEPKVVIIVGPVGSLTDAYRADGELAAKAAHAAGATVETIYSPNATWPRVRDALQGASLVVYLGHGNGWPSRYRNAPWPTTQNGLGLNPLAGVDDHAHQYFGEAYLARAVHLAPNAVVVLAHLCYASGNSEPGLPGGDLATGQQRVDNYAAGWVAAGANAVVAEGYGSPDYYVRRILAGEGTIETIWRRAPTAHGHVLAFPSVRSSGMTALMDPTHRASGFYRSLVGRAEMRADEVARGATVTPSGSPAATQPAPAPPGPTVRGVTIDGVPTAGSSLRVTLTLAKADRDPDAELGVGIRWDPLVLDPPSVIPGVGGTASAQALAPPVADGTDPDADSAEDPVVPPIALISPEVPGAVVSLGDVRMRRSGISADLLTPLQPGLYRLAVSLHDGEGVAFDASTQDRIPAFTVRVTGELSAVVSATDRLHVAAGAAIDLPVAVANTGHLAWVSDEHRNPAASSAARPVSSAWYSSLVGRWLSLGDAAEPSDAVPARATIRAAPGATEELLIALTAPTEPGAYLLVLDVVSPVYGSLTAVGGAPMVIRVDVGPADSQAVGPNGRPERPERPATPAPDRAASSAPSRAP